MPYAPEGATGVRMNEINFLFLGYLTICFKLPISER
jgi:hypothetical protein